jgi:hypothetical protein
MIPRYDTLLCDQTKRGCTVGESLFGPEQKELGSQCRPPNEFVAFEIN